MTKDKRSLKFRKAGPAILMAVLIFWVGYVAGSSNWRPGYTARNNKLPSNLDYSSVEQVYDQLRTNYDGNLDQTKLKDGLKKGLVEASGDPYTEYLTPKQAEEFDSDLSGCLDGIGAQLGKDGQNIVIIAPIPGYPAEKAGLRAKDVIEEIDAKSTAGLTLTEAVQRIRGPIGTTVKLKVSRGGEELNFTITRAHICVPSVESKILEGNIGYLKITMFNNDTAALAQKAALSFKRAGVKGVILDVRDNPGGLLDAAVDVSNLWLNNKVVLHEKRDGKVIQTYRSANKAVLQGVPTVVLVNEGSASAAEITAGALKDNNAATLLGAKTYGKGSVQKLERLANGSVLKVTIARWFTPKNKNIDKSGIQPDKKVTRSDDDYKNNRDPQLDAAAASLGR